MEQLSLNLIPSHSSTHEVRVFKDDALVLCVPTDSLPHSQALRRSFVHVNGRPRTDPALIRRQIVWEENPRPTGWWGLCRGEAGRGASVYNIIVT